MRTKERKSERIELRLTPSDKRMIQDAAAFRKNDVTDFILNTSLTEAQIALASRSRFSLNGKSWDEFVQLLDNPTEPNQALRKLMTTPSAIEP